MLLIPCPFCGARAEIEFSYGGEALRPRPAAPLETSDEAWTEFLFLRNNPKGILHERWLHAHGCRRWFTLVRDTLTYEILTSYSLGAPPPEPAPRSYL